MRRGRLGPNARPSRLPLVEIDHLSEDCAARLLELQRGAPRGATVVFRIVLDDELGDAAAAARPARTQP